MSVGKTFYKTRFEVIVLSEEPLPEIAGDDGDLKDIDYLITEGPCVGQVIQRSAEALDAEAMRRELIEAGNDGTFFDPQFGEET